ncbi:MAG: hypothetical protein JNJ58_11490 [Chitinophagaceae bacterium]|nr:hypothetical protein [Chitinophagaceae bacterium]
MKPNFLLLLLFLMAGLGTQAQSPSMYLLELENHTRWEAVDTKWKDLRNEWVAQCKLKNTPENSAQLLLQFESNVKWEAVEANWKNRRNDWVSECKQVQSNGQFIKLLLAFESNIKWSAVDESWKTRRSAWINELNAMPQDAVMPKMSKNAERPSLFKSVNIGTQTWMSENLNVDRFRNGDLIPQVKTLEEWESAKQKNKLPGCIATIASSMV